MPHYSAASAANLAECHPDLIRIFEKVLEGWDHSVVDGKRTMEEQVKNLAKGVSKTLASKHLPQSDGLSHAVDAVPFPEPSWEAIERGLAALRKVDAEFEVPRFYAFTGYVAGVAHALGIPIRQGCDWDGDRQYGDHSFIDLPHTELKG